MTVPVVDGRRRTAVGLSAAVALMLAGTVAAVLDTAAVAGQMRLGDALLGRPELGLSVLVVMVALAVTWWCAREGRADLARGVLLCAVAGAAPVWAASGWLPAEAVPLSLSVSALLVPGVVLVARSSALPGDVGPPEVAVWAAAGLAFLVAALAFDPWWERHCSLRCPDVEAPLEGVLSHGQAVTSVAALSVVAAVVAVLLLVTWARRARAALVTGLLLALVVYAATTVWGGIRTMSVASPPLQLPSLAAALLAVGTVLAVVVHAESTRRELRRLVGRLAEGEESDHRQRLAFALPSGAWVDQEGRPLEDTQLEGLEILQTGVGTARVAVGARSATVGGVGVRSWDDSDRLLLDNAWTAAAVRAHRREVVASQRRIVERSDAELSRIAGDLHDGAQQRLVSAKVFLALARAKEQRADLDRLTAAETHIQLALTNLRGLTHEAFPRLVESGGLVAALRDLVAQRPVPVELDLGGLREPVPLSTALATHAVVRAAVSRDGGSDGSVLVRVRSSDTDVVLTITDPGATAPGPWPRDVRDRVDALGGGIRVAGHVSTVVVPCG